MWGLGEGGGGASSGRAASLRRALKLRDKLFLPLSRGRSGGGRLVRLLEERLPHLRPREFLAGPVARALQILRDCPLQGLDRRLELVLRATGTFTGASRAWGGR